MVTKDLLRQVIYEDRDQAEDLAMHRSALKPTLMPRR
jgi:hypothetical protein